MTRDQAIEILQMIAELYPRFELSKAKAQVMLPALERMEYQGVLDRLEQHVAEKPYAPTLAEIAAYPREENQVLDRYQRYAEEARRNPPTDDQKRAFKKQFEALFKRGEQYGLSEHLSR
ncbi:hypothetical protein P4641_21250 [Halalkalibacterium halodurans]|uniref:hypothetical protein n=1 Tax=Halalkalibacterium halodurans TaxID=86665 RepID=UPI002E1F321A|nr:hypothetical protein [Halalkalibacterium halodurans]